MSFAIFYLAVLMFGGCKDPEPEDYLLPQGFKGRATIIFNQKSGTPARYEDGRRVYEIPTSGILLTQFKPEYGIINRRYYYIDNSGKKTLLPVFKYEYNPDGTTRWIISDDKQPGIFLDGTTGQYAEGDNAPFQLFIASPYNELDSFYTKEYQNEFKDKINKLIGSNL